MCYTQQKYSHGVDDHACQPTAETDPAPHLGLFRGFHGTGDVACGDLGIDLRGENDRDDAERQAAAQRRQNGLHQIVLDVGGRCAGLPAQGLTAVASLGCSIVVFRTTFGTEHGYLLGKEQMGQTPILKLQKAKEGTGELPLF